MKYTMLPIAAALFILSGCDNAQTSAPPQVTPEVGVVTLKSQPVSVISELTGRTTASLSAEVRPQVGGIIQKRLFTEGDMVKSGQALYQIDPSSYRAAYNEAAAALKQAQSLVVSDCQKAQRYAALESARINLNWTTVTAPIAGRIGISSVTPGALVSADQDTALATIRGLDTMYVDLTRSSVDLLRLRKQALATNDNTLSVSLTLEDGSTYSEKGHLALTEVAVDESTGSVTLRAVFPNPQHVLLPGMFVRAHVDEGVMDDAILAPQQGITRDAKGNATALVVDGNSKVEQREVETGDAYGDKWLVVNGLKSGDKLIVEGTSKVAAGQQVKAVEVNNDGGNA